MSKNLELNVIVGADVARAINGMRQFASSMKDMESKMKSLSETQKKLEKMDKIRESYNKISQQFKATKEHLEKLKAEYEKSGHENKDLAKQIKQTEKAVETLNKQKERQRHMFEAARSAIEAEGSSLKEYREDLQNVNKELQAREKYQEARAANEALRDRGQKNWDDGKRVIQTLEVPIKLAMDVEESQADLRKILGDEAKKYYADLREISERGPLSQTDIYEIAGSLAQSGVEEKDLVAYTEKASQIAVAFDMSNEAAGNFLAKTKEQLGLGKEELFDYADAINHLSDNSASRAAELAEISGRLGTMPKAAGVSNAALLGLSSTLISFNKTPEQASTGLKNFFNALTKGEASSKKATNAFKSMGIDVKQLAVDMQKDGEGTIYKVLQKLKEVDPAKRGAMISTIFGEEAKSSVTDMVENLDKVKENIGKAKEGFGNNAVFNEFDNRINTTGNRLKQLQNSVNNAKADFGAGFTGAIKGASEAFSPLIQKTTQFIDKHKGVKTAIGAVAGGGTLLFGAGKMALGGMQKAGATIRDIKEGFTFLKDTGALTKFQNGIKGIGDRAKNAGKAVKTIGKAVGSGAVKGAKVVGSGVVKGAKAVGTVGKAVGKGAVVGAKAVGSGAVQAAAKGMQLLSAGASKAVGAVKAVGLALKAAFIANPVGMIIAAIIAVIAILVLLYNKCSWFRNGVNAIFKALGTAINAVWNGIKSAATVVWNWIGSIIRRNIAIAKFTMTVFLGAVNAVWNAIKSVATAVWNAIKSAAMALWNGLKSGMTAVGSFFKSAWEGIKGAAIAVWNGIKSAFDAVVSGLKSAITGVVNFFTEKWNGLKNLVSKGLGKVGELFGIGGNYTGTNYWSGGLTTVAERGAELIQIPGKPAFLAEREMLLNLPRGTQILNNRETRSNLRAGVSSLKEKISGLRSESSGGGDSITININVAGNANTSEIERAVLRVMEKLKNRQKRTAIG